MKNIIRLFAFFLLFCAGAFHASAQGPGFTISAGANYSLMKAPNTLLKIPFSVVENNKFKTYDVRSEHAYVFEGRPGGHLSAGVQWRLSPSVLIGTGIGLQYSVFTLRPDFVGYLPVPEGSDTLLLPILITQPTCDEIIFPEGFDPGTDPRFRYEMLHLQIPLEIRLRPGKGQMELAAGVWAGIPAWTRVSKELVSIERRYQTNAAGVTTLDCIYSKGIRRDVTGDGFRNLVWGLRGELNYRFTPAVSLFAGYHYTLSNIYDLDSKPRIHGQDIDAIDPRQQVVQLGFRYLWEPATAEAEAAEPLSRLNKATHKQLFKKKGKTFNKKKYSINKKKRRK